MGLKVENVTKKFEDKVAVDSISFEIDKPGVFGLLGTNGAGKTTTIRMMLGILKKDQGKIDWNGKEVTRKNVNFGYLPEERGVYPKTKVYDQLMYFANLKGMSKKDADTSIDYWLKKLNIEEYKFKVAEKLSKGNQQKIQFITAIIHNPDLIILDEPFSGLDPVNTEMLKNIILELIEKGKYIVMSSHQMVSIEEFCTDVLILNKGKTVLKGNLKEIKNSYPSNNMEVITKEDITKIVENLGLTIKSNVDNKYEILIKSEDEPDRLYKELAVKGIKVIKFEVKKPSLHEIFIEKVGEA